MYTNAKSVLLIDDDMDDMLLFQEALKRVDKTISLTYNSCCDEAMKLLNTAASLPECIFMDINMPKMTGLECLAVMRKSALLMHIPIVIYTTSRRASDVSSAKNLGASCFFTKPIHFNTLIEILGFILRGIPLKKTDRDMLIEIFAPATNNPSR
ncbi:MAG: rcp1 3 [Bacteroidetes bacterium]|nr:rcp1 3 [Bacteroidota bacterium]